MVNKRAMLLASDEEFKELIKFCDPRVKVPSRQAMRNYCEQMYQITLKSVKEEVGKLWAYQPSYTADMWSASEGT